MWEFMGLPSTYYRCLLFDTLRVVVACLGLCVVLGYLHRRGFLFDGATGKLFPGFASCSWVFRNLIIKVASVGKLRPVPFCSTHLCPLGPEFLSSYVPR